MGPSYQGATVSLRLIKFSEVMHLSGVQPDDIGGIKRGQAPCPGGQQSQRNSKCKAV